MINESKILPFILSLSLVLFPICELWNISFYDEIFVLICVVRLWSLKRISYTPIEKKIIVCLIISYIIGLTSNLYSHLTTSIFSIFTDLFSMYKYLLVFIFLRNIVSEKSRDVVVRQLTFIAKIYIVVALFCGIISQFINIGMTPLTGRYGIKAFTFVFGTSMFPISVIVCLLIISFSKKKSNYFILYFIFSFIILILVTKGVFYSFLAFCIVFFITIRNKESKINIIHLILSLITLIYISTYQINTYLQRDADNSIRMLFIEYGFLTANKYMPFGSGFATYGSAEAAKNYSPLYYEYGFNKFYGMGEEGGKFLHDNYWATIVGELGYFGFVIFFVILYFTFRIVNDYKEISSRSKILIMSTLLMLYVSSVATGIIKSVSGTFLFSVLAILLPKNNNEIVRHKR